MTLAAIDTLLAQPFPAAPSPDGSGGPDHLLQVLRRSQEFWDDIGYEATDAAYAEFEAEQSALAARLTARWGEPATIDLWPYLDAAVNEHVHAPEPINYLCQFGTVLLRWTPPGSARWVGLALIQQDKELPLELIAVVGTPASLPAPPAR